MAYVLPKLDAQKRLDYTWFPTAAQCFIYRNWGAVSAERLAFVLDTDAANVLRMAEDMGLDTSIEVSDVWMIRGYITLIRNNWHLLDYEGICRLLGWSSEYLAYILKEDDFLDVKLGNFKSATPKLTVEDLDGDKKARTEEIKKITLGLRKVMEAETFKPFDFFGAINSSSAECEDGSVFKYRIIYSYCALYGDTFCHKDLIDLSFPDEMLAKYREVGVNGIWTQAVLSSLVPYPFDENMSKGYEKRLEGMRYLTQKLEKYGIKLYLYLNEPRSLPESFFEANEELLGHVGEKSGPHLCVSTEIVQKYLYDGTAFLVRSVPKLGGFFTITASENPTNCYSHSKDGACNCPRCSDKSRAEIFGLVNRLICEGARSANPDIKVFAYTWEWGSSEIADSVLENTPEGVGLLCVSERGVKKNIKGIQTSVRDYSISVEGPGEEALRSWKYAKSRGRDALAKVQLNNSWELSGVPFIPAIDKVYRHLRRIAETQDVNGLFMSWTLGGYPSPVLRLAIAFRSGEEPPTLEELYGKWFPNTDIKTLSSAFTAFSEAFDEFPFSLRVAYNSPQFAPANFLFEKKTGYKATMVGIPYDDIDKWSSEFGGEVYYGCFKSICEKWAKGMELLHIIEYPSPDLRMIFDSAEACFLHFTSIKNQFEYICFTDKEIRRKALESEQKVCEKMIELMGRNAAIGFEASNHYYCTRYNLVEKIINCRYLEEKLFEGQNN